MSKPKNPNLQCLNPTISNMPLADHLPMGTFKGNLIVSDQNRKQALVWHASNQSSPLKTLAATPSKVMLEMPKMQS